MEYLVVGSLGGLILWTAGVAWASWSARGLAAKAAAALRDDTIEEQAREIRHLEELLESAAQGEELGVGHLRRRLAAAGVRDPSERRRLLYPERAGELAETSGNAAS